MCSIRDFFPIDYKIGGTKPKKNFLIENRKYVTKLAKSTQASKENENPSNNIQKLKLKREASKNSVLENPKTSVKSVDLDKIDASIKSIRSMLAQTKIAQEKLNIKNEKVALAFRDQAVQTVNPYNEEDVLKDSIIRYSKVRNSNITNMEKHMNTIAVRTDSSKLEYSNSMSNKNTKSVRQDDINLKKKQLNGLKENIIGHQPGQIPKYLKDRKELKEKNEKEMQKKLAIRHELGLDDPACPPGHILLPEVERLDHLVKIKKDYSRLVMQLNMLPVSSDSYKMKEKRKHIEEELDKLQLGIKLFSREKLYVKINQKIANSYK